MGVFTRAFPIFELLSPVEIAIGEIQHFRHTVGHFLRKTQRLKALRMLTLADGYGQSLLAALDHRPILTGVEIAGFPPAHLIADAVFSFLDRHGSLSSVLLDERCDGVQNELKGGVGLDVFVGCEQLLYHEPDGEDSVGVGFESGEDGGEGHGRRADYSVLPVFFCDVVVHLPDLMR